LGFHSSSQSACAINSSSLSDLVTIFSLGNCSGCFVSYCLPILVPVLTYTKHQLIIKLRLPPIHDSFTDSGLCTMCTELLPALGQALCCRHKRLRDEAPCFQGLLFEFMRQNMK
jgi:hypothetical protein